MEWPEELWNSLLDENHRGRLLLIGGALAVAAGGVWTVFAHFSKKKGSSSTQVIARDGEPAVSQKDWNIQDALEWWEQVTGLNRGDEAVLDFFSDLRQAASDGNITVWGRANSEHRTPPQYTAPFQPIPAEHWIHVENTFDMMRYVNAENEDMIRDAATPPGRDSTPVGTRYVDLRLTSTEVKENVSSLIARKMSMFDRLWKFLSEEKNLEILSFIGAIIVALIGGTWTAYIYFSDNNSSPKQHIVPQGSSAAVGGNITAGGDIHIGITLEQHEASLKRQEEEIRKEYAISAQGSEKRALLEKELAALEQKRTHLEESLKATQKVYADTVQLLEEKLSAQLPSDRIEQAKTAINKGNPAMTESLLEEMVASGMQQSAEASYILGLLAKGRVDYEKAWQSLTRAAELAPDNPLYLNKAGWMADTLGRYDTAIEYYDKALAIDLETHGPEHPNVARVWGNLGEVWRQKGEYDKAMEYFEKALASDLKTYSPDHPNVATLWNNLGNVLQDKGKIDKAIEYYEKALASDLKTFGPDHPHVAAHWNNLGTAWFRKGEVDKAIEYFEKALASDLKTYSPDHPDVATGWVNLGNAWQGKSKTDKAIGYYEKALAIDIKTFGSDHPNVARDWINLGNAWQNKGAIDKAIEYYEKAFDIDLKTYGPDHPGVALDWSNLGSAWQAKGEVDKAIEFYAKALASNLKTFGPEHPKVATSWNNLGTAWTTKGDTAKAREYYEKALAVFKKAGLENRARLVENNIRSLSPDK